MSIRYQILDWNLHYENNKSRLIQQRSYVGMPNKQHGLGFTRILAEPDGASIYGIFCLIIGACSRQRIPREGWLTDDGTEGGRPWTVMEMALRWRRTEPEISRALQVLCCKEVGWITLTKCPSSALDVPGNGRTTRHDTTRHDEESATHSSPTLLGRRVDQDSDVHADESPQSKRAPTITAEEIYQAYPRHVEKQAALKAVRNALTSIRKRPGIKDPEWWLLDRTRAYASARARAIALDSREEGFTPYPQKWFNKGRYDDDDEQWEPKNSSDAALKNRELDAALEK